MIIPAEEGGWTTEYGEELADTDGGCGEKSPGKAGPGKMVEGIES